MLSILEAGIIVLHFDGNFSFVYVVVIAAAATHTHTKLGFLCRTELISGILELHYAT
jgi:hypothetical protein